MRNREGFILIAALWLIVALSAVGLDAALRSRAERAPALNQLDRARAQEAALAGTEYARSRLTAALLDREAELRAQAPRSGLSARQITAQMGDTWRAPHELLESHKVFGDLEFMLDVHDTGLAVNVNEASLEMLRNLLGQGLRLDIALADRIAQSILDWRDENEDPRINGGEAEQYIDADMPVLPRNQRFTSVDEVRFVLNMTPEIFEMVKPYLTVVGAGRINVNAAPEVVLLAIPTFTPTAVAELMRRRNAGMYPNTSAELFAMLARAYRPPQQQALQEFNRRVSFATNEVEIVAVGRAEGSPFSAVVRTVVQRAGDGATISWRKFE
jgi:general secretion pathway protein K